MEADSSLCINCSISFGKKKSTAQHQCEPGLSPTYPRHVPHGVKYQIPQKWPQPRQLLFVITGIDQVQLLFFLTAVKYVAILRLSSRLSPAPPQKKRLELSLIDSINIFDSLIHIHDLHNVTLSIVANCLLTSMANRVSLKGLNIEG